MKRWLIINLTVVFATGLLAAGLVAGQGMAPWTWLVSGVLTAGALLFSWHSISRMGTGLANLTDLATGHHNLANLKSCGIVEFDDALQELAELLRELPRQANQKSNDDASHSGRGGTPQPNWNQNSNTQEPFTPGQDQPVPDQPMPVVLQRFASSLRNDFGQFTTCGREIGRTAEQIAKTAEEQSTAVNQSAQLVEQISEQIDTVLENAKAVSRAAESACDSSGNGLTQIEELLSEFGQIESLIASRGKRLRALGENTLEISGIVEAIGQISSRTDLLAINASIESVRAGEHGRGFAIVADEVRNLAEQSAKAARDAAMKIEFIQSETQQSVSVIDDEHAQIQSALLRLRSCRGLLEKIAASSAETLDRSRSMSDQSRQQFKTAEQFVDTVQVLSRNVRGGRSEIEGIRWTAKSFGKLAKQFHQRLSSWDFSSPSQPPMEQTMSADHPFNESLDHSESLLNSAE